MIIKRTSILTGKVRSRDIDVTPDQLRKWNRGGDINLIMSNISKEDREFLSTGTVPEEWKTFAQDSLGD